MKISRGQNKPFFQNASLLLLTHFCSLETGYFLLLKTLSVRYVIKLLFKVQLSPDYLTSNKSKSGVFKVQACFANFTALSMLIPITNCLPFFFRTDRNFYQIILSHTLDGG